MSSNRAEVKIGHWDSVYYGYGERNSPVDSFSCIVQDDREKAGQVMINVEHHGEKMLYSITEINSLPYEDSEEMPCIHVSPDMDGSLFSVFRAKDKVIVRLDVEQFSTTRLKDGSLALVFDLEGDQ